MAQVTDWKLSVNSTYLPLQSKFSHVLLSTDWEAFGRYAFRIRALKWLDYELPGITKDTQIELAMLVEIPHVRPRLVLLPALRTLSIKADHLDYITLFLHPGIAKLQIEFTSSYIDTRGIQGVQDLLLLIPTLSPTWKIWISSEVHFPRFWFTDWVIDNLESLPHLERIDYVWDFEAGGELVDLLGFSVTPQSHSFPTLSSFSMELDFPIMRKFLAESSFLERLLGSSLTSIDLDGFPAVPTPSTIEDTISISTLEPLLQCSKLIHLGIQYPTQFQFSEDDLRTIGVKLTKLRRLFPGERLVHVTPPLLNLSALSVLVENFPCLESIGLYVNTDVCDQDLKKFVQHQET
ncbi:hypothetical protein M422DRAFT_276589 [Sphaerobolus stellatus SS14]|uniref:Uncharacterized protein n=1 Tax=Sphaerobolus stellatus (strain SS14) TaxID=990650 RepID=A0A0C9U1P8_SPHS4|nr:hypothetical protein M422DRAFT_276589 [Sphaerobolus stellatus SS14]